MGVKLQSSTKSFNVSSEIQPPFPIISSLVNSHLKNYARKIPPTKRKTDLNGPNEKVKKWTELRTTNNNDNKQKCPALSHFLPTVQCNTIQLYWQVSVQLRQDCFMVPNTLIPPRTATSTFTQLLSSDGSQTESVFYSSRWQTRKSCRKFQKHFSEES